MAAKSIDIQGYGKINIIPIMFKDKEYDNVDMTGQPLNYKKGSMIQGKYYNTEGLEVPSSHICKKIEYEGEVIIQPKMSPTKEVAQEDVELVENDGREYDAIEKKVYKVFTDNKKLNDLILSQRKSLVFPFVAGSGYKMHEGVLTAWKDQIVLCLCRGSMSKAMETFQDDVVEFEIEAVPQKARKLLKAMCVMR